MLRLGDALLQAGARPAVVAEGIHGRRRHGVDRVGADQLLDVEDVAIGRVLGAGAGPEQPLRPRALGREPLPAGAGEEALVALVGELGVGDRDLAAQALERGAKLGVVDASEPLLDLLVDRACRCG